MKADFRSVRYNWRLRQQVSIISGEPTLNLKQKYSNKGGTADADILLVIGHKWKESVESQLASKTA